MQENKKNIQDMPYERFLRFGPGQMTESELLAIILRTGTKEMSAVELASNVLSLGKYPREGLLGLYDLTLEELMAVKGIGSVKAIKLKCLTELSMRMSAAKAREGLCFHQPGAVAEYFMEKLRHRQTEAVLLVCLDAKGQILCEKLLSEGSVRMSLISPREVFLEALQCRAVNFLLVHNHPSGDPSPSRADKELTGHLKELGQCMDILLLDHIIIGDKRYFSFKEASYI